MFQHHKYMDAALIEMQKESNDNEVPVGAVIVKNHQIIASCHNSVKKYLDPTAHAEILCIRKAAIALSQIHLYHCDIYITMEPCAMCTQAIAWAKIKRIYFAAYNQKFGAISSKISIFHDIVANYKPEVYGGIREIKASQVLKDFFFKQRCKSKC